jgi:hypothetical protein
MMYFNGMPYEDENDYCIAIDILSKAIENYDPSKFGYTFARDITPIYNFGASGKEGALFAIPVMKI